MSRDAKQILSSIDAAQRHAAERMGRKTLSLERLLEINRRISTLDLSTALCWILESLIELTATHRGALMLKDPEGHLRCEHAIPVSRREIAGPGFDVSRSIIDRVLDSGEMVRVLNVPGSDLASQASVVALGLQALMAIPLKSRDRILGVIYVDSTVGDHRLADLDPTILLAFGSQAAIAIDNASRYEELQADHELLHKAAQGPLEFAGMLYASRAMHRLCRLLRQVCDSEVSVLIQGETGTGKELVARALHVHSLRRQRPFVAQNAGALPDSLLASELFGHRAGAFSGARDNKTGLLETADRGTVFLDEIGEASPAFQVSLLRFLETGTFRRLGETTDRKADVRLIAATHRDLAKDVESGRFRADLYYRLNVFPLRTPPLRERPEDIPILVEHFVEIFNRQMGKQVRKVSPATLQQLRNRPWQGNVRQLRNVVQRLMILSSGETLAGLEEEVPGDAEPVLESARKPADLAGLRPLAEVERDYVRHVLECVEGNQSQAARILGLNRSTLRWRLKKLGLVPGEC